MYEMYTGVIGRGFQFASGGAVDRKDGSSPFSDSTLKLQHPHFKQAGIDFDRLIPNWRIGTINIELGRKLRLVSSDYVAENVDWTANEPNPAARIPPETFHFVHCCLALDGFYHPGLLYYPDPCTKPGTNRHNFDALEVIAAEVPGVIYGKPAAVICRTGAFVPL